MVYFIMLCFSDLRTKLLYLQREHVLFLKWTNQTLIWRVAAVCSPASLEGCNLPHMYVFNFSHPTYSHSSN